MNQKFKYGLALTLLGTLAIFLVWRLNTEESKKLIEESKLARISQSHDLPTQGKTGIVPPADSDGHIVRETKEQREIRLKNELMNALNSPVNFWGKVVDEEGVPISGAKAEVSITNKFSWNPTAKNTRTKYVRYSDSNGLFSLLDKKGGSLYVQVSADGYASSLDDHTDRDLARANLSYSEENDHMHFQRPTEANPMVFVLRKKYPIASLAHAHKKGAAVSKTGDVQKIELRAAEKIAEVEIRCWSSSPMPFTYDKYDWKATIQIAGAKLKVITEFEPVTAPTDDYEQVFKIEMSKDTQENWLRSSPNGQRDFWVLFDDGTYAKARIEVKTGRTHEVDVEVWYNLDGTNNFEQ